MASPAFMDHAAVGNQLLNLDKRNSGKNDKVIHVQWKLETGDEVTRLLKTNN